MAFSDEFPQLSNFLGSWFPDADLEGLSHEEIVAEYLESVSSERYGAVTSELDRLLGREKVSFRDVSDESNIYFDNEPECRKWLEQIRKWLKRDVY